MSAEHETLVAADDAELAALSAELFGRAVVDAVRERGVARVALSGGSTPGATYRKVTTFELPWPSIEWWWVDERAVPPDHDRSNYRAAAEDLGLSRPPVSRGRVRRMRGEVADLAAEAGEYGAELRRSFGVASAVSFDVMVMGVGDDGHTASLFPGMNTVSVTDRLVLAVPAQPAKGLEARLTLTAPVIQEARLILVLAKGAKKREVLLRARSEGPEDEVPSRLMRRAKGRVVWIVDEAAAP